MNDTSFQQAVTEICARDPRFAADSYYFLREALDYTVKALKKPADGPERHVSGKELCEGLRELALQEFGPMALTVLQAWGLERTEDIGEIVFNLVEVGKLGKTDKDDRKDFVGLYDFHEAFSRPYEPPAAEGGTRRARRTGRGKRG